MLASRFEATAVADIMADDTMELSSEHGQNIGDEDIDIDIDFSAGHADEDYVLEDATSNADFGDEFHPQPSPAMGHDELMIDEGDETYSIPVDGADLMRDDDIHQMDDEALAISSAPTSIPTVLVEEIHVEDTSHSGDGHMSDEVSWEVNDEPELTEAPATHHESHHEDGEASETAGVEEVDMPAAGTPHEDSRPSTPHVKSPKIDAIGEEPRSPPATISAPKDDPQDHASNQPTEGPNGSFISQDIVSTIDTTDAKEIASIPSLPEVVVVYQDSEYSLFSKSETDDIDSYFLSDFSIKDKPLSTFFEAIRDVIREDLNDDDELCMSVEDLGLELEEVSCTNGYWQRTGLTYIDQLSSTTQGVTIGQLISLHEKLLQNDGVESIGPLCLQLGTRPNFSIRFANLVSGASEGKGLSELVQWDEESESLEDSAHVTENEHGEESEGETYEGDEALAVVEKEESKAPQQQRSDDTLAQDPAIEQEQKPHQEPGNFKSLDASDTAAINGVQEANNSASQHTAANVLQKNDTSGSGEDEDGDILDYSDEDEAQPELRKDARSHLTTDDNRTHNGTFAYFIPPCLKPQTCFCSKCNDLLLAEYEAVNEELRRRSISRAAEDKFSRQATETSITKADANHEEETNVEAKNGIEYDENDVENLDQGNLAPEHEDQSADFGEDHTAEFDNHEDEFYIEDGDVEGEEAVEGYDLTIESTNVGDEGTFDEFDFGEDDNTQQHQELPISDDQEARPHEQDTAPTIDHTQFSKETVPIGSSLGFADAPGSESAASEKTLEAQPVSPNDLATELNDGHEDEIGYDDDEESDAAHVQAPNVKEPQATSNASGKRQRVDDDGMSTESKGICRQRLI
jgi:hypothetical protein